MKGRYQLRKSAEQLFLLFIHIIALYSLASHTAAAHTTPKVIQSITAENGGTNTVIYDIEQDSFKRIWLASADGVFIYNGKQAEKVWPLKGSANAYSIVSSQDTVYASGNFGIVKFDVRSLKAEPFDSLAKYPVYDFVVLSERIVFNQYDNGLYQLNLKTQKIESIAIGNYVTSKDIKAIRKDKSGTVWVAVHASKSSQGFLSGGLLALKNGKVIGHYLQLDNTVVNNLTTYNDNFLISTSNKGILEFDPISKTVIAQHYPSKPFPAIDNVSVDNNGCFWLATMSQAQRVCGQSVSDISGRYIKELPASDYQTVYFDTHNEIVWLGAINGGVRGIHAPKQDALTYSISDDRDTTLSAESIFGVRQAPNGDIWLAYNGEGIDIIDAKTNAVNHVMLAEKGSRANHILSLAFDPSGTAFIGSFRGGVWHKKPGESDFTPFIKSTNEKVHKTIVMDFAFESERVWVATIRELFELTKSGEIIRTIPKGELINQGNIYGVMTLDNSHILLATSNGLLKVNKSTLQQKLLNPVDKNAEGCDDGMMDFTRDSNGMVWYVSRALCKYDPTTEKVTSESRHPLFIAGMTAILALPDGKIAGHDGKVAIYDPKDKTVQIITKKNGHFIDDSTQNFGAMTLIDNQLVIALSKGLLWYDLNKPVPTTLPDNPLFIKKLTVMNKPRKISQPILQTPLPFSYDEKVAFLDFKKMDFFNRKFEFRIDMPTIMDSSLRLDKLDGFAIPTAIEGQHKISVMATYAGNNTDNLNFAIDVKPPYWRTPTAYVLYAIVIIMLFFVLYSFRLRQIKHENKRLELLVAKRTKDLQLSLTDKEKMFENISHEFRTPLTIIIGKLEALLKREKSDDLNVVHTQSLRLLSLVEKLLKLAEFKSTIKEKEIVELAKILPAQIYSFESLCVNKQIKLTQNDTSILPAIEIIEDSITLIINNLVGNAIKYADEATQVSFNITINNNMLTITVENQASDFNAQCSKERFVRFNNSEHGHGLGLAIVDEVARLNNGTFTINFEHGVVSAVVKLPIKIIENSNKEILTLVSPPLTQAQKSIAVNTIMLVEDNIELNQFIHEVLSEAFNVIPCCDGKQALETLKSIEKLPDLILSDVVMPNLDGISLTQAIKADTELNAIPVVLLTAKSDVNSQREGYQALADDYIAKPFNSELLLNKLTNLITTAQAIREKAVNSLLAQTNSHKTKEQTKISTFLEANFSNEGFSIHQLAEHMSVSPKTLNRKLQAVYGLSFSQLVRDYRLEKAREMLLSGLSAKEVSFNCGFSSQAYFGQCFKEKFNISPGMFQRQKTKI